MGRSEAEVVIVGAGAAGLAAARRLHDAGVDCLLLEARPRLGGRAWTVEGPAGAPLDLGCGWLHSADRNPWPAVAEGQGRAIDRTPPPWGRRALPIGFPLADQADFLAALQAYHRRMDAAPPGPDVPAAHFLDPGCRWNALIGAVGTYVSGAEPDRVSARDLGAYDDSGVNWRVAEGYGTTVAAFGAGLPAVLECPVTAIDHGGRRLRIETGKGAIAADRAIVAVPSGVLAGEGLRFSPALPERIEAAAGLPLGLAIKLFLSLPDAEAFEQESRLFGRTDRTETAAYHFRPFGRPLVEAYFGGRLAASLEAGGPQAFFEHAKGELGALLGSAFAERIAPVATHLWGADPWARGSYSYALPGKSGCRSALARPVDDRLFFAGEACSEHDFSTAHGAFLSGRAAAGAVLAARGSRSL
ncbi:flavin monoamine oxidase family protein [Propylenella binzhouense]|uniref:Tryptophan 2-monooxygenase n=1 Tax=Propylenella binzhouense TaxID=2555902 RepID=A0A964T7M1_9HYPH|nr:NAD(P)/FAD-dependent oxidoreductase [Propylenella binzhouense]MYZ49993.1 FAD-dependent oxidoreductase [Propylenella binzhouense]